jgi:N-acetyl-gamma-glutamyl-phosphate reductase
MAKRFRASVIGGSGYGGAEIIRRLLVHPDVDLVRVASIDHVGERLASAIPSLEGRSDLRFENVTPLEAADGCDVVFAGLPHKVSAKMLPEVLEKTSARVVDLSGDFRLKGAAAYERYYGAPHPRPDLLGTFVYGLPEIHRERIASARAVASPGCFATTIALGLLPIARAGLLSGVVHTTGITGSSGSGALPSEGTHHPVRASNLRTYRPLTHQHTPEIEETLASVGGSGFSLRFIPISAPLPRGILAISQLEVPSSVDEATLARAFESAYAGERFVRIPEKRLPEVVAVSGSNHAEVGFVLGPAGGATRTVTCLSALDNLVKGGAGQAVQSMNVMLGLREDTTLEDPGPWP